MIAIIIEFFILLGFIALLHYYLLDRILFSVMDMFLDMYPSAYPMTVVNFVKTFLRSTILLLVLIGGAYYVLIQTQREKTPEGYYP